MKPEPENYAFRGSSRDPWERCDGKTAMRMRAHGFEVTTWADAEIDNLNIVASEKAGRKTPRVSVEVQRINAEWDAEVLRQAERNKRRKQRRKEFSIVA